MKILFKNLALLTIVISVFGCSSDSPTTTPTPTEVVKTKYTVTSVTITEMPFTKPNSIILWDGINNADVFMWMVYNNNNTVFAASTTFNNATISNIPINWNFVTPYQTTNFSDSIYIWVWDDDVNDFPSADDELIGIVPFNMTQYTIGSNKYPSSVTQSNVGVTIKLNLTWE